MQPIAKVLIISGLLLAAFGLILNYFDRIPFLGKLPGDINFKGKNFSVYFPIVTSILLSLLLSLMFYFITKYKK